MIIDKVVVVMHQGVYMREFNVTSWRPHHWKKFWAFMRDINATVAPPASAGGAAVAGSR